MWLQFWYINELSSNDKSTFLYSYMFAYSSRYLIHFTYDKYTKENSNYIITRNYVLHKTVQIQKESMNH